ncbi:MAG: zinc-ribbon domain-containing protein [Blastocatellia bacterium]
MFCPKCGTENPKTGKFCRSCGVDLGNVSAAMSGSLPANLTDSGVAHIHHEAKHRNDPNEVYADAVKSIISGIGFIVVSMALFFTGVAGGRSWWWAMLFPAFTFLAKGISEYLKYGKMQQSQPTVAPSSGNFMGGSVLNNVLPSARTEFVAPESRYKTGDLVPPSVTDSTTKLLEIDSEGQTMTLPKK